jgi:hypothetical protein
LRRCIGNFHCGALSLHRYRLAGLKDGEGDADAFNHYLAYHEGHGGYRRGTWRAKP